ncbi:TonB-dependent receptor [Microbulbifer sp.]|uniref:TonB-dependent receptor domain-containing protein n=1 Tax=Microbulbifer sp. TaxID=1908541 RepID=UPI00258F8EFB|nr:TonB-dependent receptor [Microbulbifer sp.]
MPKTSRRSLLALLLAACLHAYGATDSADPVTDDGLDQLYPLDIPSQPLDQALLALARQTGLAVMIASDLKLRGLAPALSGEMSAQQALEKLLMDSGYRYRAVNDQGLVVLPPRKVVAAPEHTIEPEVELRPLLEELEVVASKRRTQLQDTPMAITAFGRNQLRNLQIDSLEDLAIQVPSLQYARNGDHTASLLYMRGIGSDNHTEAGDSGVAIHVDGLYSSRAQGAAVLLYDLDRIEVLRGPQGSLFGRNSTGGVINYHTARPQQGYDTEFSVTLGNFHRQQLEAMVNLPLGEEFALRWAGISSRADGYTDYTADSVWAPRRNRYNNVDQFSQRLSVHWQPRHDLHWWASVERYRDRGAGGLPMVDYGIPVTIDTPGVTDLVQDTFRSRLSWRTPNGISVTYIGGYGALDRTQAWDGDRTGPVGSETDPAIFHQSNRTLWSDYQSRQHELQLKSDNSGDLRWLLAYFDFAEDNGIRFDLEHQTADGSGWGGAPSHSFQQPERGSHLSAVYGQLDWDVNEYWELSTGARSGRDHRYDRGGRNIACPDLIRSDRDGELGSIAVNADSAAPGQCYVSNYNDVSQSWRSTTAMARATFRPAPDRLFYLLFAQGFKPGIVEDGNSLDGVYSGLDDPDYQRALEAVIARNNSDDEAFRAYVEPETNANIELGFKLGLRDGAMTLNGALFNTRYRDLQVSGVAEDEDGTEIVRSTNAASATIRGLEMELTWATSLNGQLNGFFSLLDARYDRFFTVDNAYPRYGQTWNPAADDSSRSDNPDLVDYSGNRLKQAPRSSLSLNYTHTLHLGNWASARPTIGVRYSDRVYFDEANRGRRSGRLLDNRTGEWVTDPGGPVSELDYQPAYWLWSAGVKIEPVAGNWWLNLFGENLTNNPVRQDLQDADSAIPEYYLAQPRTLGLEFGLRFQ